MGTQVGVSEFDGHHTWTTHTASDGLADNNVQAIAVDMQGNKWFGTYGKGITKFDDATWTTYTHTDGLANDYVQAIAIDAKGNKWIGTYGGGVSKFDGAKWTTYTTSNGLASNIVRAIAIDAQNNIWFGTNGGISKLSGANSGISSLVNENSLHIFPNPVHNELNINFVDKTGTVMIIDISGKCLMQKQLTEKNTSLDVSGLVNGIYIIMLISDSQICTKKIVKY
jgi:ligand-binding sensor domain-containing protein